MTIFGLDSAGKTAGIAILRDSRLIYECYLATGHTHSETLLCLCKNAFDAAGLSPAEIDVFAAAAGPGSFTGLRIGLAAVKGLAFPHDTPCAAVSTLEALAYSAAVEGTLLCALDARRGEVYWAGFFAADGAVERLCPDESAPAASLRGVCGKRAGAGVAAGRRRAAGGRGAERHGQGPACIPKPTAWAAPAACAGCAGSG